MIMKHNTVRYAVFNRKAIELYVNAKGSLKNISEITGVTVRMIMRTLRKKNIPLRMDKEIFDRGMEDARTIFGF